MGWIKSLLTGAYKVLATVLGWAFSSPVAAGVVAIVSYGAGYLLRRYGGSAGAEMVGDLLMGAGTALGTAAIVGALSAFDWRSAYQRYLDWIFPVDFAGARRAIEAAKRR